MLGVIVGIIIPEGLSLQALGIQEFDPAYGGGPWLTSRKSTRSSLWICRNFPSRTRYFGGILDRGRATGPFIGPEQNRPEFKLSVMKRLNRRRTTRRAAGFLLALLNLCATSVVALDAVIDGESAGTPIHLESHEATDCETHHDHLFCQVVRSLGSTSEANGRPTIDPGTLVLDVPSEFRSGRLFRSATLPGFAGPRGPPLL